MLPYFDLHTHLLFGVDDGAKTREEMFALLDMAYADGTRAICLTPHFSPYLFGDTASSSAEAFLILKEYAAARYPELQLFLGHELGYYAGCTKALESGACRTLGGSRYLLVDFPESVDFFELKSAMGRLQSMGHHPVLAHAERYPCLVKNLDWLREFRQHGGIVQVNASSAVGAWGRVAKTQWKRLIKARLVHVVSSDGHNLTQRQPKLSVCMPLLTRWCDEETVARLVWENAWRIVRDETIWNEDDD